MSGGLPEGGHGHFDDARTRAVGDGRLRMRSSFKRVWGGGTQPGVRVASSRSASSWLTLINTSPAIKNTSACCFFSLSTANYPIYTTGAKAAAHVFLAGVSGGGEEASRRMQLWNFSFHFLE